MTSLRPDLLPPGALEAIGGPAGRHTDQSGWWRAIALRLVVLVSVPMSLAIVQREHCVRFGWLGQDQFWRACFSDLPAQYALGALDRGLLGYLDGSAVVNQPVVAGTVMSLLGSFVPDGNALDQSRWYVLFWVALVTVLLAWTVWCTALLVPADLQGAAQVALSPVVVLAAILSADALAVALVATAMVAWRRDRVMVTGILLGLGTLTRGYVAAAALALVYVAIRGGVLDSAKRVAAAALATMAAYGVVFVAFQPDALTAAYTTWWGEKAGYGSPWLLPTIARFELPVWSVTALAILGIIVALMLGWVFVRDAYRTPTWPQAAFVVVAVVAMTGKAMPVQASLWLLPLAAAAGIRWRDHLIWAGAEIGHFVAVWMFVGALTNPNRALPGPWYAVFVIVRLTAVSWLVWRVWQASAYPPPVRRYATPEDARLWGSR